MNKNILIMVIGRAGKTTLSKMLKYKICVVKFEKTQI